MGLGTGVNDPTPAISGYGHDAKPAKIASFYEGKPPSQRGRARSDSNTRPTD